MSWDDTNLAAVRRRCEVCKAERWYTSKNPLCAACYAWAWRIYCGDFNVIPNRSAYYAQETGS